MEIVKYPHPALITKSALVNKVDEKLKNIFQEMIKLTIDHNGVGLAANQIGYPLQFFIVKIDDEFKIFINPVIISRHGPYKTSIEGCLSAPELFLSIPRQHKIKIEAYDEKGNRIFTYLKGDNAIRFTHEYDHVQGMMFFNHIDPTNNEQIMKVGEFIKESDKLELDREAIYNDMRDIVQEYGLVP